MINLVFPTQSSDIFVLFDNYLVGPLHLGDAIDENIEFRSGLDYLGQGAEFFGEKAVDHVQVEGNINYCRALSEAVLAPFLDSSFKWPQSFTIPLRNYMGVVSQKQCTNGLLRDNVATITRQPRLAGYSYYYHSFARKIDNGYEYWVIGAEGTRPNYINACTKTIITNFCVKDARYVTCDVAYEFWSSRPILTEFDWSAPQTGDTIMSMSLLRPLSRSATAYTLEKYWVDYKHSVTSARAISSSLDAIIKAQLPCRIALEEKDYGDLAMEASQSFLDNSVNMIEFFRDLRHPTDMIPKLRNLRNLKDLSNNYLSAQYGVLPTISDLESIWEAANRLGPYIDKNGLKTHSAGHIATGVSGDTTRTLEQHLKLAIGAEDDLLESVFSELESLGFLPNLSTVWELIPYSFVVDWFVHVGDLLERADSIARLSRYNVKYVTMSRKETISMKIDNPALPYFGSVKLVHYQRWVSDQCPVPPLTLQSQPDSFNHWLESGALIIQRAK